MKLFFLILIGLFITNIQAASINVEVDVPRNVVCEDEFKLIFIVNTSDVKDINLPSAPFVKILYGPSQSVSHNSSVRYTYILEAVQPGQYILPAAEITLTNGKKYKSKPTSIKILPKGKEQGQENGEEIFIRVFADKQNVREQEAVILTYKVYTKVNLKQLYGNFPDLKGFLVQEIPLPQQKTFEVENYGGENYRTTIWSQYILFPQSHGNLIVPSVKFEGVIVRPNHSIDPFEDFLNGNSMFAEKKKAIMAPSIQIHVDSLPFNSSITSFYGGVGTFRITSKVDKQIKSDEAFHYRIIVSGSGNLKMLKVPSIKFPKDFEVYDPKIVDNSKITSNGLTGTIEYDFMIIPRKVGTYKVPSVHFTYYDLKKQSYQTIKTADTKIEVSSNSKRNNIEDGNNGEYLDIRTIKYSDKKCFYSMDVEIWIILYILCFVLILGYFYASMYYSKNKLFHRGGQGDDTIKTLDNKIDALIQIGAYDQIYNVVSDCLWSFLLNKIGKNYVPNIREWNDLWILLEDFQVSGIWIEKIKNVVEKCNMAKYALSAEANDAVHVYKEMCEIIKGMEKLHFKKEKDK